MVLHDHAALAGLAPTDQQIIYERWPVLRAALMRWLPPDHPCSAAVERGQTHPDLHAWFVAFE